MRLLEGGLTAWIETVIRIRHHLLGQCGLAGGLLLLAVTLLPAGLVLAQGGSGDEQARLLEVRQRQVELRASRSELARAEQLYAEGLAPRTQLEEVRTRMELAQLSYQSSLLSLLGLQPRISVQEAVKYEQADGRKFVRLTVRNLTPTFDDSQLRLLENFDGSDPIPPELRTRDVRDVFISVKDTGEGRLAGDQGRRGTTVALPYERHIPELPYGATETLTFHLLRDVNSVLVTTSYKGQEREIDVQLQQAETAQAVNITSTQISQEADLGAQATYSLLLSRSTVDVRSFELKVLNLPQQVDFSFVDPTTEARLSQLNFPAGVTEQSLELRLFLPEQADERVPIDQSIQFWAIAMNGDRARFSEARRYSRDDIAESHAGALDLQVIPRGVGRIEVAADTLFSEVTAGDTLASQLTVRNTGTRRLDTVKVLLETPINWRTNVVPAVLPALDIDQEEIVALELIPPVDLVRGDYEVRIRTESYAYNRRVPSEDKIFRISVRSRTNLWLMTLLALALVGVAGGMVFLGIRLSRR